MITIIRSIVHWHALQRLLKYFFPCVYLPIRLSVSAEYIKILETWKRFFVTKIVLKGRI